MKKLFIISNESVSEENGKYFCDNIDMKSTPEGLEKSFEVCLLARNSKKPRSHEINIKNIKVLRSIFSFIKEVIKISKIKEAKYLIISISPYTFFSCIILKLLKKKPIVYLRSDGYGEYKSILGFIGPAIYHMMFSLIAKISYLISCREYILRNKDGKILSPSQLDENWFTGFRDIDYSKIKLLYIGRIRVEKGIFSLLNIIKDKNEISLSIIGAEKNLTANIVQSNVEVHEIENQKEKLINIYDSHNILILPSFTEGHPMVLLESLARKRPVIIFEEIKHVIGNKKGIFVSKRNYESLVKTINYIKQNYKEIGKQMGENKLPTNKDFIKDLGSFISYSS